MEVELQNPAVSLCSWKHVDTEMFGANNRCLTLIYSNVLAGTRIRGIGGCVLKETKYKKLTETVYYHSLRQRLG